MVEPTIVPRHPKPPTFTPAILDGRHPPQLSATKLKDDTRLSLDWTEQRSVLGFA